MKAIYSSAIILAGAALMATAATDGPAKTPRGASPVASVAHVRAKARAEALPFALPLLFDPTQEQFARCTVLDANGDGKTWKYMSAGHIEYGYNDNLDADEWLFIPVTTSEDESFIKLTIESRVQGAAFPESFEVAWGDAATPSAMTVVLDVDNINHTQWKSHETAFGMQGAGVRWLGLHANSAKGQYGLKLRNLSLELNNTPVPLAPALTSSAIDGVAYTATVALPSSTVQGKPIEGKVGLAVAVDGTEVTDYPDCSPGGSKDVALTLAKGRRQITFTAYLTVDGQRSLSQAVEESVRATSSEAVTLPFFMVPTAEDFDSDCDILDANGDSNTWIYSTQEHALQYSYNANRADDWIFLPAIDFGAKGGAFDLSVDTKCESPYSPEAFEICVGRMASPSAMTPMLSCPEVKNTIWETRTGTITIPEGGIWYVGIHCTSAADQWNLYVANISITAAPDNTPGTPSVKSVDFTGTSGTITYTLPALTADGRPATAAMSLIVTADGTEVTRTEPGAAGTDVAVPLTLPVGRHTITASATTGEGDTALTGAPAVTQLTVTMPAGYAYPLPFEMRPTQGEFETLTTLDAAQNGINWEYNSGADNGKGAMVCRTVDDKPSDAWVFMPAVDITDASRIYTVKISARAYLERFPEDFEVCIGTDADPASMHTLIEKRGFSTYIYEELAADYIAPAPGKYIIGIHRSSGGEAHTLSIHSAGIADSGRSAMAPSEATGLTATAAPSGELKATVAFTMPSTSISGAALSADAVLTATVSSDAGATATVTGAPGSQQSATVAGKDGFTTFTVEVSSADGGAGRSASVRAYCGFDKPGAPVVATAAADDNLSMTVTWTDATAGANGGAVDTGSLRYNIYKALDAAGEYWSLLEELPVGTASYTFTPDNQLQDVTFIAVAAINDKGLGDITPAYEVLGVPYPLPMADDFSTGRYLYDPLLHLCPTDEYSPDWYLDDPGLFIPALAGAGTKALMCVNTPASDYRYARLALPKFSTESAPAVTVSFTAYSAATSPKATVYGSTAGAAPVAVGELAATGSGDAYRTATLRLPAPLLGRKWVSLWIEVEFGTGSQVLILKDYEVRARYERQLATTVSCPPSLAPGETYTVTGKVTNFSETAQAMPRLACTLGDIALEPAFEAPASLEPGATATVTYTLAPTADMIGDHTLRFALLDYTDQVPADDAAEMQVSVVAGDRPIVLDLTGTHTDAGFALSWSAPEIRRIGDDDVESYEPYDYSPAIGPWLNVDGDGQEIYGIGVAYPGQYEAKAFQVFDTRDMPADKVIPAYSGTKYFMAVTPEQGPADDWLISPEVIGGTKVSFRLNILSEQVGAESVDVLYSTTGRDVADFTLLKTFSQARIAWNPLEVTLPADARYFAFHYRCDDLFGICLDDISYSPVSDADIAGYHVYCNDVRIADTHTSTAYLHDSPRAGDRYNVAVVTATGPSVTEHPKSNTVVATVTGIADASASAGRIAGRRGYISITGAEGLAATVHTPDGRLAAAVGALGADHRVELPAGLYLVSIEGAAAVKATVR